ncbi:ABC transporter ATP-binding protein [Alsobacter sp. R-9]
MSAIGPAIRIASVTKRYGRTLALDGVSFDVPRQQVFALLGPNGAGKTTLMHILCTILAPDGGVAEIAGFDVRRDPVEARSRLGIVFQEPSLDDRLTVRENLEIHGLVFGVPQPLRRRRIAEMLAMVDLTDWADKPARALSSGMKRRVEIARALIHDSEIMLLDEPTAGLDAQSRARMWDYVRRLKAERQLTVLVTTHYIEEVEDADQVCIIDKGKVLAIDTPAALRQRQGEQVLVCTPRSEADHAAILARFADRIAHQEGGEIAIRADEAFIETFLDQFGNRVRALSTKTPSLETAFLSLTGRELRDRSADARDVTLAFGKRGGEHTR